MLWQATNVKLAADSPASYEAGESGANFTLVWQASRLSNGNLSFK